MRDLAVVFDLDGTLIGSAPEIHAVALEVPAAEGLPPLDLGTVKGCIGRGVPDLIARRLAHLGTPDAARQARMAGPSWGGCEGAVALTTVYPGAVAAPAPAFAFADWAAFAARLAAFWDRPGGLPLAAPARAL